MQPARPMGGCTTMAKPIFTQIIERARAYVAVRSHWTRYTLALTGNNRDCEPTDAKAARFCAYGALVRAGFDLTGDVPPGAPAGRTGGHVDHGPRKPGGGLRGDLHDQRRRPRSPRARPSCGCSTRASRAPDARALPSGRGIGGALRALDPIGYNDILSALAKFAGAAYFHGCTPRRRKRSARRNKRRMRRPPMSEPPTSCIAPRPMTCWKPRAAGSTRTARLRLPPSSAPGARPRSASAGSW